MRFALVGLAFVVFAVLAPPAWATFPGRNGLLAFSLYVFNEESTEIDIDENFVGIADIPGGARHIFARGSSPSYSPDGRTLAYSGPGRGIWLTRPDCRWPKDRSSPPPCSRLRRVTRGDDLSPAWSPTGKRIAFVRSGLSRYGLSYRIYTVRANGGGLRFLGRATWPAMDWSSKGALAFTGAGGRLRVRGSGGRVRTLPVRGREPSWAPAGNRLAFVGEEEEPQAAEGTALYTIHENGTGLRKIWEFEDQYAGRFAGVSSPIWSPDGRWIAFIATFDPITTGSVFAIRPRGSGLRLIMRPIKDCLPCSYDPYLGGLSWRALRR
jgi:Tol biopolymer transport system component